MFGAASYCSYSPFQTRSQVRLGNMPFISCGGGQGNNNNHSDLPTKRRGPCPGSPTHLLHLCEAWQAKLGKSMPTSAHQTHETTQVDWACDREVEGSSS